MGGKIKEKDRIPNIADKYGLDKRFIEMADQYKLITIDDIDEALTNIGKKRDTYTVVRCDTALILIRQNIYIFIDVLKKYTDNPPQPWIIFLLQSILIRFNYIELINSDKFILDNLETRVKYLLSTMDENYVAVIIHRYILGKTFDIAAKYIGMCQFSAREREEKVIRKLRTARSIGIIQGFWDEEHIVNYRQDILNGTVFTANIGTIGLSTKAYNVLNKAQYKTQFNLVTDCKCDSETLWERLLEIPGCGQKTATEIFEFIINNLALMGINIEDLKITQIVRKHADLNKCRAGAKKVDKLIVEIRRSYE